jgi:hypothetical protein
MGKSFLAEGQRWGSREEYYAYKELELRQVAKEIGGLEPHPRFQLIVNGTRVGHYTADARYFELHPKGNVPCVWEHKGFLCSRDAIRLRVFRALYPDLKFVKSGKWNTYKRKK